MLADGQGLRASDPPGRRTATGGTGGGATVLDGRDRRARAAQAGAHPRRRLWQRAQHGRARPPRRRDGRSSCPTTSVAPGPRARRRRGGRRLGARDAVRRRQLRPGREPGRDRAPRGRPRRAARAASHGRPRRRAAGHRARLPVAVERPRRDQPPPSPLHPPLAAACRRAGRLEPGAHDLLQLAAAARGDRPARARSRQQGQDDRVEPRSVGAARRRSTGCSSARSRSRPR